MFAYFRAGLLGFAIFTVLAVVAVLVVHQMQSYEESKAEIQAEKIAKAEDFVKNMVVMESAYVASVKKSFEERKMAEIEANVQEAYDVAYAIFQENHNKMSSSEVKRIILKTIASLKSSSTRQLVLVNTTDGVSVHNPNNLQFEGKSLLNFKDATGVCPVEEEVRLVRERGHGYRYSVDTLTHETKVTYVKEFPPFKWYFVSIVYPSNYYEELKMEVAKKVSAKIFGYKGDVFIYEADGNAITTRGRVYVDGGEKFNIATSSIFHVRDFYKELIKVPKNNHEGAFMHYKWYPPESRFGEESESQDKIAFVHYNSDLNWYIGSGFFAEAVEKEIDEQLTILQGALVKNIIQIFLLFALVVFLGMLALRWFERYVRKDFDNFVFFFKKSAKELSYIDHSLMNSQEFRDLGVVANEMIAARQEVEKRLIDEQEKAKEADRLKSSFLANMSHEIRTPMNAIIGFSNFLVEDLSLEERREFVGLIKNSGETLLGIIDSIIDFSKIEVGQIELKESYVSYDKICYALSEKYNYLIEDNAWDVEFVIENQLPIHFKSLTDETRLMQVLRQLLDNAFKFTHSGKVVLNIGQNGDRIYFKVIDTGIGISEENLERVFDRFMQLEGKLSRNYGGTGIGLAIASKLVEMLGGEIWVESKLNKGSQFQFYIPFVIE